MIGNWDNLPVPGLSDERSMEERSLEGRMDELLCSAPRFPAEDILAVYRWETSRPGCRTRGSQGKLR